MQDCSCNPSASLGSPRKASQPSPSPPAQPSVIPKQQSRRKATLSIPAVPTGSGALTNSSCPTELCLKQQTVKGRRHTPTGNLTERFFCVVENEWLSSWCSFRQDLRGTEEQNGNATSFRQTHKALCLIFHWWPLLNTHVTQIIFTVTPHKIKKEENLIFCLVWSVCFQHTEASVTC